MRELQMFGVKPLVTPGVDGTVNSQDGDEHTYSPLGPEAASEYRALAALCNYIAVDRCDGHYAINELCRDISTPAECFPD